MTSTIGESRTHVALAGSHMSIVRAGRGHPVVLAHSYLWDAQMWRPQIDALSPHYNVIVPELWGHGMSGDMPGGTRSLRDLALHHLAVFDRLGLKTFTLVGLSVGAMWAAELALIAPERVRGLVLMDSFMGVEPPTSRQRFFGLMDAVETHGHVTEALLDAIVPLFFSPSVGERNPELPARFRNELRSWDPVRLLETVVPLGRMIFGRRDGLDDLKTLSMPALVMTGADDLSRPPHEGRTMAGVLKCPFIEIADAGHISSLEAPEAVSNALLEFLEQVSLPVGQML